MCVCGYVLPRFVANTVSPIAAGGLFCGFCRRFRRRADGWVFSTRSTPISIVSCYPSPTNRFIVTCPDWTANMTEMTKIDETSTKIDRKSRLGALGRVD